MFVTLVLSLAAAPATNPDGPGAPPPAGRPDDVASAPTVDEDAGDTVSIKTRDGFLVSASYYAPRSRKQVSPAALLLHDAGASREGLYELASYLNKKGFAVLVPDLRGHGESVTDDYAWGDSDERGREMIWSLASRDVDAASSFLLEQSGVHSTNLSVFGMGAGAALAVRHATDDENVRSVSMLSPRVESYGYNLANGIADLGGLPTLILSAREDREVALRLQSHGHDANGGLEYVTVQMLRNDPDEVLEDKKLRTSTANWLRGHVMRKK